MRGRTPATLAQDVALYAGLRMLSSSRQIVEFVDDFTGLNAVQHLCTTGHRAPMAPIMAFVTQASGFINIAASPQIPCVLAVVESNVYNGYQRLALPLNSKQQSALDGALVVLFKLPNPTKPYMPGQSIRTTVSACYTGSKYCLVALPHIAAPPGPDDFMVGIDEWHRPLPREAEMKEGCDDTFDADLWLQQNRFLSDMALFILYLARLPVCNKPFDRPSKSRLMYSQDETWRLMLSPLELLNVYPPALHRSPEISLQSKVNAHWKKMGRSTLNELFAYACEGVTVSFPEGAVPESAPYWR